jgi:hypothetical protein
VFGSSAAGGRVRATASHLRPKLTLFIKTVCPLSACATLKTSLDGAMPSLSRIALESQQKGKFWCGQNLPFCLKEQQKKSKDVRDFPFLIDKYI